MSSLLTQLPQTETAQPPADLIVKIGPGIRTLIDAAAAGRR